MSNFFCSTTKTERNNKSKCSATCKHSCDILSPQGSFKVITVTTREHVSIIVVPRHCRITLGHRAFSVAEPMAWNALPDDLRDPSLSADNFRKGLKMHLFRNSASEVLHNALYKFKTYLLTYLLLHSPTAVLNCGIHLACQHYNQTTN